MGMPAPAGTVAAASHALGADPSHRVCAGHPLGPFPAGGLLTCTNMETVLHVNSVRLFPPVGDDPGESRVLSGCAGFSGSSILSSGETPQTQGRTLWQWPERARGLASVFLLWPPGPRSQVPGFAAEHLVSASSVLGARAPLVRVPNSGSSGAPLRTKLRVRPPASCRSPCWSAGGHRGFRGLPGEPLRDQGPCLLFSFQVGGMVRRGVNRARTVIGRASSSGNVSQKSCSVTMERLGHVLRSQSASLGPASRSCL